jgi:signal transduction histidine kinase
MQHHPAPHRIRLRHPFGTGIPQPGARSTRAAAAVDTMARALPTARHATMNQPRLRLRLRSRSRLRLPPAVVMRAYLIGWMPLALVYTIANETDGDFSRGFNLLHALHGTARNVGPAFLLLLLVWPYTGWMERLNFSITRLLANHAAMSLVFACAWHGLLYLLIWLLRDQAAADGARERWFIWQAMWGMMMYWAVAGGFTAYRAVQRARAEAAASAQATALIARTELAALRNKLNPHFLFNTLHSLTALVRRDPKRAENALLMFSDMLRYVLETEKSGDDSVCLQQELDFTRDYLGLEALRLGERLTVDWQVDQALLQCSVPALSVQPLVENSIKHAFNPRSTPGRLTISARRDGGTPGLHITVADDGPGCSPQTLAASTGLGLKTVARRLALAFGARGRLDIHSQPGAGFQVQLSLPLTG